jgi:hypothetical protein
VQWNLYGPDFHFAVRDDLSIGFTTSWVGIPIIGNIKKSWQLRKKIHFALGEHYYKQNRNSALVCLLIKTNKKRVNLQANYTYLRLWRIF